MNIGYKSLLVAGMLALGMTGCLFDSGDDTGIEITNFKLSTEAVTLSGGSSSIVNVEGNVKADEAITSLTIKVTDTADAAVTGITTSKSDPATDAKSWDLKEDGVLAITVAPTAKNGKYKVTVEAKAGAATTSKVAYFTVSGGSTGAALTETVGKYMYNINGPAGETGAFDLKTGTGMASSGSDAVKDLLDINAVGTTYASKWESKNGATFVKANSFDYTNATKESIKTAFDTGTAADNVDFAEGDIILVKLSAARGGDYVAIKITAVENDFGASTGGNKGRTTFSYKM